MELELGLKITHTRDDLTSTTNLQLTKDHSGPLFVSKEIDSMFILEGHLKGVRKEDIDIDINKNGNRITIIGKTPVQEMVLMGWIMHKKDAVMRMFKKSFRIPDRVKLDRIKAKFNDETSVLTIRMPKWVKGFSAVGVEELEEEDVDTGRLEPTETVVGEVPERVSTKEVPEESERPKTQENVDEVEIRQPLLQDAAADEIPEQSQDLEVLHDETLDQAIEQAQSEEEEVPERINNKEKTKEKPEEDMAEVDTRKLEEAAEVEPTGSVREPTGKANGPPEGERKEDTDQIEEKLQERPENELQDQPLTEPEPHLEPEADDQTIKTKLMEQKHQPVQKVHLNRNSMNLNVEKGRSMKV